MQILVPRSQRPGAARPLWPPGPKAVRAPKVREDGGEVWSADGAPLAHPVSQKATKPAGRGRWGAFRGHIHSLCTALKLSFDT
eukprot:scaffold10351_cov62-Phaeocystis_antarctica.AAC.9